jgi:glutamate-1-semialdehyde 2,1-aminomutase
MILGHAFPPVLEAIKRTVNDGTAFGAPTERETELAELIISMVPSIQMVRLVNSGTEATMSAIRLARGYTRRDLIVKFEGCYHGHGDSFLIAAGSGALTFGIPDSPGVTQAVARTTLLAQFNDIDSVKQLFQEYGEQIAAVIVEPVVGNMGVIIPEGGFLRSLREITKQYGALLIFDEVMTGFRLSSGGAQGIFGILPDITTLGKIIGGGMPIAAYGGSEAIMSHVAPLGAVYQAGTLSGNPLAVAAGIEMLKVLKNDSSIYEQIGKTTEYLSKSIQKACTDAGIPCVINQIGSMMTLFFTEKKSVKTYADAIASDREKFSIYFRAMLESGIYLPPSQFESWFISASHGKTEIDLTLEVNEEVTRKIGGV